MAFRTENILVVAFMVLGLASVSFAEVQAGQDGNGGDTYSLEFVNTAHGLLAKLQRRAHPDIDLEALTAAINETQVEATTDPLFLNGIPKHAINYPAQKRIIFSIPHWLEERALPQRSAFVLHEYLGIIGLDDSSYRYSQELLNLTTRELLPGHMIGTRLKALLGQTGYVSIDQENILQVYDLSCLSSIQGDMTVLYSCSGLMDITKAEVTRVLFSVNGETAQRTFEALLLAQVEPDTSSEPGTTYLGLSNLACEKNGTNGQNEGQINDQYRCYGAATELILMNQEL